MEMFLVFIRQFCFLLIVTTIFQAKESWSEKSDVPLWLLLIVSSVEALVFLVIFTLCVMLCAIVSILIYGAGLIVVINTFIIALISTCLACLIHVVVWHFITKLAQNKTDIL